MKVIIILLLLSFTIFAKEFNKKEFVGYWNLGSNLHQKNPKEAINNYKKAIEMKEDPFLYGNIADCYRKLNNNKEARRYFDLAIKISKTSKRVIDNIYYQYSYFLYKIDNKKAKEYINKAIKINKKKEYTTLLKKIEADSSRNIIKSASNEKLNDKSSQNDKVTLNKKNKDKFDIEDDEDDDDESEEESWITKIEKRKDFRPFTLFRGFYKNKFYQDRLMENGLEDASEWNNSMFLELKHQFSKNTTVVLSSDLNWYLLVERNETNSPYLLFNGENVKSIFEYSLRESYIDYKNGLFSLRIGSQIFKWGANIGFPRSDVINYDDFSSGIIPDVDKRKLPTFAINSGISFQNSKLSLILVPIRQNPRVSLWGRDFSVLQPSKKTDTSIINRFIDPTIEDELQSITPATKDQKKNGLDSSIALRFTSTFSDIDFSALLYYGFQQIPEIYLDSKLKKLLIYSLSGVNDNNILSSLSVDLMRRYSLGEDVVKSEFTRWSVAALSLSYPVKSFLFKIDSSYKPNNLYYTSIKDVVGDDSDSDNRAIENSLNPIYKNIVNYTFGIEYQYMADKLIFDFEFTGTHVLNDYGEEYLYVKKDQIGFFSFVRWKVIPDSWTLFLLGNYNIFFKDYLFTIRATKHYKDLDLEFGYDHFGGDDDALIGRYDKNDQFFISLKYFF